MKNSMGIESMKFTREASKAVRPHCDGVHLMAIKATHRLAEIITKAELG